MIARALIAAQCALLRAVAAELQRRPRLWVIRGLRWSSERIESVMRAAYPRR